MAEKPKSPLITPLDPDMCGEVYFCYKFLT